MNERTERPGELITAKALAAFLKKHPNTIYRWAKQGKIPSNRVFGCSLLFDIEEVKAVVFGWKAV